MDNGQTTDRRLQPTPVWPLRRAGNNISETKMQWRAMMISKKRNTGVDSQTATRVVNKPNSFASHA